MEHPFSSKEKEKESEYWPLSRAQVENFLPFDGGARSAVPEDVFTNFSDLLNFDSYAGWCNSPAVTDQASATYGLSSLPSVAYAALEAPNFIEQSVGALPGTEVGGNFNLGRSSFNFGDKIVFQPADTQFKVSAHSNTANDSVAKQNNASVQGNSQIDTVNTYRPTRCSLDEKMLRALAVVKESSGGGILAQVWVPVKRGDQLLLSTSEQPYLLDHMLAGYREVSRMYTFGAEGNSRCVLGLPGRVFVSKVPEWTSNVCYYQKNEYLRAEHAFSHQVRGSMALPVFEPDPTMPCCAVLELVTTKEKSNFDKEMEIVCNALQAVNLRTNARPRLVPQCFSNNQKDALAEIIDVLRAVCHAHRLPLALTWIPCCYTEGADGEFVRVHVREGKLSANEKCILCIEETACYVNDRVMQGFAYSCMEHHLEEGQGLAGKALQSNLPFFLPDVKTYDINEFPLVHHARKFGLNAAVAIRLRSTYTGDCDYILEFFLPVNMKGASEQQLLLNNLSGTMQRICKNLRTVSDTEIGGAGSNDAFQKDVVSNLPSLSRESSQMVLSDSDLNSVDELPSKVSKRRNGGFEADGVREQGNSGSRRQTEKKRSTSEKNVSLSVLQQYFSGSLKDAAKSIGVCPTTLKRICRQHGISRWPSRKINKVNRSLKKIQTVLDSVQGVEGGLKFDPTTGGLVAAGSIAQEFDMRKGLFFTEKTQSLQSSDPISAIKSEEDDCTGGAMVDPNSVEIRMSNIDTRTNSAQESKVIAVDAGSERASYDTMSGPFLEKASFGFYHAEEGRTSNQRKINSNFENSNCHHVFRDSVCLDAGDEMDTVDDGANELIEHNQPASSSMTDSSNGSGSMLHGSSSSSQSFENPTHPKGKTSCVDSSSKIAVKATYKEDTVRFKFDASAGCLQLYEEVAKRFKLQTGTFQLKYLDDEEEWVMLVSDMDLQECLEILDDVGTRSVKFQVRDMACAVGSSGSSNCFLAGGS